jgi:type IV secretory pathway VirB6-like protein
MGLVPEFFVFLGIVIFLGMSLLSALLDRNLSSRLQYFFQIAAMVGLGELVMSQRLVSLTRFWVSMVYLASALSSVVGLNVYLWVPRRRMDIASTFSETVTVPVLMISAVFVYSFLGNGGEVSFSPAAILTIAVLVLVTGLSVFGFLRELSRQASKASDGPLLSPASPASAPPWTPGGGLALPLPSLQGDEWEESTEKREGQE